MDKDKQQLHLLESYPEVRTHKPGRTVSLVYLDNIIIYLSSVSQHFKDLQRVWDKLHEARLSPSSVYRE